MSFGTHATSDFFRALPSLHICSSSIAICPSTNFLTTTKVASYLQSQAICNMCNNMCLQKQPSHNSLLHRGRIFASPCNIFFATVVFLRAHFNHAKNICAGSSITPAIRLSLRSEIGKRSENVRRFNRKFYIINSSIFNLSVFI